MAEPLCHPRSKGAAAAGADGALPLVVLCDYSVDRRTALATALVDAGCRVREVNGLASLLDPRRVSTAALVLIGVSPAQERETLETVEHLRSVDRALPLVFVVTSGSEALAVGALRAGVNDYFREPFNHAALTVSVKRIISEAGRATGDSRDSGQGSAALKLVGSSRCIRGIEDYLRKVAARDVTVLITGETGTGKELVASQIHAMSRRGRGRFVSVNCAAIPEGLFESELFGHESGAFTGALGSRPGLLQVANQGTVFLDEVGDMGLVAQAKVLRAIESKEVYRVGGKKAIPLDVRIVAATNQDLERCVDDGRFRKDLYFRLNVVRVHLPPLRERRSDVVSLLDHYLREFNRSGEARVDGFSDDALDALQGYDWPGNVRELKNMVEALFVSPPAHRVGVADLPESFRQRLGRVSSLSGADRRRLVEALFAANWNKSQAAAMLHVSRMTVYRKIAKYSVLRTG
jgi:DNA-binding NtrC family response regulator